MSKQITSIINISKNLMVPMRDGIKLATDIYRPADKNGIPIKGKYPTILGRTSYDKTNPVIWVKPVAEFFVRNGYVVILQDLRGRGDSQGTGDYYHTANEKEGIDGYDTVEWIASQTWSNGNVGMVGASHGGIVQNMASIYRPPNLKALWVDVAPTNAFKWEARQGGAMALHMYGALYLHGYDSQEIVGNEEAIQIIEQGAINLEEEVLKTPFYEGSSPIKEVPNLEKVLMHYYRDGVYNDWWSKESLDQTNHFEKMADIPSVYSTGWYDPFTADVSEQFVQMKQKNSSVQKLIIGPWNHVTMRGKGSSFTGEVEFGSEAKWGDKTLNYHRLKWFDRWLKGIENKIEFEPSVQIFRMGGGDGRKTNESNIYHGGIWKTGNSWPPSDVRETTLFLNPDNNLDFDLSTKEIDSFSWIYNPSKPVPTISANVTGFYKWLEIPKNMDASYVPQRARMVSLIPDGPLHQRERSTTMGASEPLLLSCERKDVVVFETKPIEEKIEVIGPVNVTLYISSSSVDTDFTAKLLDIYPESDEFPEGFHLPLADSIIRARFRNGFASEEFMNPGDVYQVKIELPPIANLFVPGHKLRLEIASSNFPRFDINPNTGEPLGKHTKSIQAKNTVYVGQKYPSCIKLFTT